MFDVINGKKYWQGYSDTKPSESIQRHDLPGLGIAATFVLHPNQNIIPPIRQFKYYSSKNKAKVADKFSEWLTQEKENGLIISGIMHAHQQKSAAKLGLEIIEELPDCEVIAHHKKYRLKFAGEFVDFKQATAIAFYLFTICFGMQFACHRLPKGMRRVILAMDRFPGQRADYSTRGQAPTVTQGHKFLNYVVDRSATYQGLKKINNEARQAFIMGHLGWWRDKRNGAWRKGKDHPFFAFPDWAAAAAIANEFGDELASSYPRKSIGKEIAYSLANLHSTFKAFDLWSMDANVPPMIRTSEKLWNVPNEARQFIFDHAAR